jgi:hypothetical protein
MEALSHNDSLIGNNFKMKGGYMGKWLALLLVAAIIAGATWSIRRQHKLATGFEQARTGESEAELSAQLGKPWKLGRCGQVFGDTGSPHCTKEYLYASPYAPLKPEYWALRFNETGQLIEKYRFVSP